VFVVPGKQERDTKRTESTSLSVELLVIADVFDQLFDGDGFLILVRISSGSQSGLIDQNVRIGRQPSDVAGGMRAELIGLFRGLMGGSQKELNQPVLLSKSSFVSLA
jgi:hypothetical protein